MPRLSQQFICALLLLLPAAHSPAAPTPRAPAAVDAPRPDPVDAPGSGAAKPAPPSELASVLKKFDSLMDAGAAETRALAPRAGEAPEATPAIAAPSFEKARALCTGGALRMFPFLALSQSKLEGFIDTARSQDENLEERTAGAWGAVKVRSHVVFTRPFLGQTEMSSVQAVHLYRAPRGWLIAEFEELENEKAPLRLRSGRAPADSAASPEAARAAVPADIFPISPRAPDPPVEGDSMRYRLRLKNGDPLAALLPTGPSQSLLRAEAPSKWILVNRRVTPRPGSSPPPPDSLKRYLASDAWLDLGDTALTAAARRIVAPGEGSEAAAGDIYRWVSGNFRFSLGAVLFGTSREVLRGMTGDCSEAAVLTAALLRACGVPARVAVGFASVGRGVFIGHAWAEAWLGEWVGVDAALGQYPAGVERIELARLDGSTDMRIVVSNLMLAAISNLDVEILDVWKNGRKVPLKRIQGNASEGVEFFEKILTGVDGRK